MRPSPDLLETLYQCQRQQDWFREYLVEQGMEPLPSSGARVRQKHRHRWRRSIRKVIGLTAEDRARWGTRGEALGHIVHRIEAARILVMRSGIVGDDRIANWTSENFAGFALSDDYAPLVFVNASDPKAAQIFSLPTSAHIWLGQSGVSDVRLITNNSTKRH